MPSLLRKRSDCVRHHPKTASDVYSDEPKLECQRLPVEGPAVGMRSCCASAATSLVPPILSMPCAHTPHGFIFTTALPPAICAAATAAIRHLKASEWERPRLQDRAGRSKVKLRSAGLPIISTTTHIVPVVIGDPQQCRSASDLLLARHGIYIQPINYPTVPRGRERLRIAPTPLHGDSVIDPD
jgi:hypothetical protein